MSLQEQIDFYVMVGRQLPELLAQLVQSGKKEDALSLLVEWGTHSKPNSEIWGKAKELLAIAEANLT